MKRWTALVLVVCLLLGMGTARAASGYVYEDYVYVINEFDDSTVTIVDWIGDSGVVSGPDRLEIPAMIHGRTVTQIDGQAFVNCPASTYVIPPTVEYIGKGVFNFYFTFAYFIYFLGDAPVVAPAHSDNEFVWASIAWIFYDPNANGWSSDWNGYSCYPMDEPIVCTHMDEYDNLWYGDKPEGWIEEEYPVVVESYLPYSPEKHLVKTQWKYVCVACEQEVVVKTERTEVHEYAVGGEDCLKCGEGPTCRLSELTDEDYLAFSSLAYKDAEERNVTVYEMLANEWNSSWEGTNIKVSDLYSHIQDWVLVAYEKHTATGFYAMAFQNSHNEVVIAYRGSIPCGWQWIDVNDVYRDWVLNDLHPILGDINPAASQFQNALDFYDARAFGRKPEQIAVTGHSLGGGLAAIVSGYSGSKGVAFNGVAILDTNYFYHPEEMSINFRGIDKWNYVDHVNEFDTYAGMWEVEYKNAYLHRSLEGVASTHPIAYLTQVAYTHPMSSIIQKKSENTLSLTTGSPSSVKYKLRELGDEHGLEDKEDFELITREYRSLYLGDSSKEVFRLVPYPNRWLASMSREVKAAYVAYGGDGGDILMTYRNDDTLIGGPGNDYLDGGTWGNDLYIYNKGDGIDHIADTVGNDRILLQGFDESDEFYVVSGVDGMYTYQTTVNGRKMVIMGETNMHSMYSAIMCNNEPIIFVDNRRADNQKNILILDVNGKERDITNEIQVQNVRIYAHYEFSCPIDIDILDADGNVVYTVKDSQLGNFYNDYGNFYVLPNEDSPYNSKIIDLFEGYSIKIRGIGEGKMSLLVQDTDNYELLDACGANEVSITSDTTGTIEEDEETGIKYLLLDSDGDGDIDETIPLNPVHFEVEDHDSPMEYVPAQNATCVEDGVAAHYLCSCGRIFKDAEAKEEITDAAELVLPATGQHNYVKGKCTVCGQAQPRVPQTGDNTPLYAFCAMSVVAAAVLVVILRRKKKA